MSAASPLRRSLCLLSMLLLAGCEGGAEKDPAADAAAVDTAAGAPAGTSQSGAPVSGPVTVEDIDPWERGMAAELAAVQQAGTKLESAKTGDDTLAALMGVQEMTTISVGAKAAGMDEERYNVVRTELSAAVGYLTPHLGGVDTTQLSPAQREELRQMNAAQLKQMEDRVPAEVVDALKPRAEALRKKNLELAGARLKSAGM